MSVPVLLDLLRHAFVPPPQSAQHGPPRTFPRCHAANPVSQPEEHKKEKKTFPF